MKEIRHLNDSNLVRALAHPLRARILGILQERRASPRELAEELDASLGTVSYHVRTLAALKLIKLVKETPRRGAIEHHYEATRVARVSDAAWEKTPALVKDAMVASALQEVARTVNDAASLGGFARSNAHLTRTPLTLDERGWNELAGALSKLLERAERIQAQSTKRLRDQDHAEEARCALVMMLFESVPAIDGAPTSQAAGRDGARSVPRPRNRRPTGRTAR